MVCIRTDAGFGTDQNLNWVLNRNYQVVAKNNSGRRAGVWGQQATQWQELEPGLRWVCISPRQLEFCRPTRTIALRWFDRSRQHCKHALFVVTDLVHSPIEICHLYDLRGATEVQIRSDKRGLLITERRKHLLHAQEALIVLSDLAHNFLTMFRRSALVGTPLADFGPYRLVHEVMNVPGEVIFGEDTLLEVRFQQSHPYARILAEALPNLWK